VRALAGSPLLARLETLSLLDNDIGEAGARALLHSPHLRRLTDLRLNRRSLGQVSPQTRDSLRRRYPS
jgi:hypothetical protein